MCFKIKHHIKHAVQMFTHASKEGRDIHLNEHTAMGTWFLLENRKQITHKLSKTKGGPYSYGQHHSGCLHKQGWGDEVGPPVCPTMENPDLVLQETIYSQSSTDFQQAACESRQIIQASQNIQTEWFLPPEVFQAICSP